MKNLLRLTSLIALLLGLAVSCGHDDDVVDPPKTLDVKEITSNSATLSWTGGSNADGYKVAINDGIPVHTTETSFKAANLAANTKYTWKVQAIKGSHESTWIPGKEFTTLKKEQQRPAAPTELTVGKLTPTSAELSWKPVEGVEKYNLVLDEKITVEVNGNFHSFADLTPETTYKWKVQSVKDNLTSDWVNGPDIVTPQAGSKKPQAPTNLLVSDITDRGALLSWKHVGGQSFEIVVNDKSIKTTELNYRLTELTPNTKHVWKICAAVDGVWSDWADGSPFTTEKEIAAPTDLAVEDITASSAKFSWKHVDADKHEIKIGAADAVSTTNPDYQATGLTENTKYTWKVRSAKSNIWSEWVEGDSFTTIKTPPAPPTNLIVANITTNSAQFSWTHPDADKHEIKIGSAAAVGTTNPEYQATGLSENTEYTWKVRSYKEGVWSAWANGEPFTTEQSPSVPPSPPTDLAVMNVTSHSAKFTWTHADADSHEIKIGDASAITRPAPDHTATGLTAGTEYSWKVRSKKNGLWSDWADGQTFTTEERILMTGIGKWESYPWDQSNWSDYWLIESYERPGISQNSEKKYTGTGYFLAIEVHAERYSIPNIPDGTYMIDNSTGKGKVTAGKLDSSFTPHGTYLCYMQNNIFLTTQLLKSGNVKISRNKSEGVYTFIIDAQDDKGKDVRVTIQAPGSVTGASASINR